MIFGISYDIWLVIIAVASNFVVFFSMNYVLINEKKIINRYEDDIYKLEQKVKELERKNKDITVENDRLYAERSRHNVPRNNKET